MIRKNVKQQRERFYLITPTKYGYSYYGESGVFDVGTPREEPYLYWTRYLENAHAFRTAKTARAMARKLLDEKGVAAVVTKRDGDRVVI